MSDDIIYAILKKCCFSLCLNEVSVIQFRTAGNRLSGADDAKLRVEPMCDRAMSEMTLESIV